MLCFDEVIDGLFKGMICLISAMDCLDEAGRRADQAFRATPRVAQSRIISRSLRSIFFPSSRI